MTRYIALMIVAVSLALGLSDWRIFPFSNFPMYQYSYDAPEIYSLEWVDAAGVGHTIPAGLMRPLTRLHFSHTYFVGRNFRNDSAASVAWIADRVKTRIPEATALRVSKLTLKLGDSPDQPYHIVKSETVDEFAL